MVERGYTKAKSGLPMSRPDTRSFKKFDASLHVSLKLLLREKDCVSNEGLIFRPPDYKMVDRSIALKSSIMATILLHVKYCYESMANFIWILFDVLWILFTQSLRVSREFSVLL